MIQIKNGYKLAITSLPDLGEKMHTWRSAIRELTKDAVIRTAANLAINALFLSRIDPAERAIFGEMYRLFKDEAPSQRAGSFMTAYSTMQHAEQRIEQQGVLEPSFDFKSELILFPLRTHTLAMLFTVNPVVKSYFDTLEVFQEYSYTDEALEGLSEMEKKERTELWNTALEDNRVPMLDGLRCSFYTSLPMFYTVDVVRYINEEMNLITIMDSYAKRIAAHRGQDKTVVLTELLQVLPAEVTVETLNEAIEL